MSGQVSSTLQPLADAVDDRDLPVDNAVLTEAFALADRLNAKLLAAVSEHDSAEVWRNDGATSMTAWLRHHTRQSGRQAARCTTTARRLHRLPVTAAAYRYGVLSVPPASLTRREALLWSLVDPGYVPAHPWVRSLSCSEPIDSRWV